MNSTDVYFIFCITYSNSLVWMICTVHCASEYQVSGLRQLLMGSILPENGPKMSNEALFDIDQLQECMVPKSSLLDDDWWWSWAYLSVGPMKFKKSLKKQMCNKGFGYTCRIWGRKGGMSKCLQEKHKIIRISKTTENQKILNWNVRFLDLKNTFFAFGKHWFLN